MTQQTQRNAFGLWLRAFRKSHKLTQTQVGALMGKHQTAIAMAETGERPPDMDFVMALVLGLRKVGYKEPEVSLDDVLRKAGLPPTGESTGRALADVPVRLPLTDAGATRTDTPEDIDAERQRLFRQILKRLGDPDLSIEQIDRLYTLARTLIEKHQDSENTASSDKSNGDQSNPGRDAGTQPSSGPACA